MTLHQVRVTSGAKQDAVLVDGKTLLVSVRAKDEDNQANVAMLRVIKKFLHVKRIELVSGHHRSHKVVRVA